MSLKIDSSDEFATEIIACRKCPRVLKHCRAIAEKKIMRRTAFAEAEYWGKPVPNFGSLPAKLLVVGLAPGAHGSNRTSRMFTGDDSGLWLYRALHKAGFAETAECTKVGDNRLIECSITAVTHCAPPGNKPSTEEIKNCETYLKNTIRNAEPKVILALGAVAWKSSLAAVEKIYGVTFGKGEARPIFKHGSEALIEVIDPESKTKRKIKLIASYHVSRQNTNTGRLTEPMLDKVFHAAKVAITSRRPKEA